MSEGFCPFSSMKAFVKWESELSELVNAQSKIEQSQAKIKGSQTEIQTELKELNTLLDKLEKQ